MHYKNKNLLNKYNKKILFFRKNTFSYAFLLIYFILIIIISGCATSKIKTEIKDNYDIAIVGDIMLGRNLSKFWEKFNVDYPFELVKDELKSCSVVFGNLECPLVYKDKINGMKKNGKKKIHLYAEDDAAKSLENAGFNIVSLANNHSLDYGQDGIKQTMELLTKHNIKYSGIWKGNLSIPNAPVVMEVNGTKIGFLCYSDVSHKSFAAGIKKYGTIPASMKVIRHDIKNAKNKVDILIVYLHWGKEYQNVKKYQIRQARNLIDLGVDMIVSSHTHLFQDIEMYKEKYIFYGLGNFVFDMKKEETKYSAIVKVKINNKKIEKVKLIPVYLIDFRPEIIKDNNKIDEFFSKIKLINIKKEEIF